MKSRRFHVKKGVNMSRSTIFQREKPNPGRKQKGEKEDPKKEETRGQNND
jgi:hypothetical protein